MSTGHCSNSPAPPRVSVVIPTFNRGALVVNAVRSALSQDYEALEVIVVDDGSTDDTASRIQPFDARVRYVRQENRGVSAARNRGFREARGELIAFLDSDDEMLPGRLSRQVALMDEHEHAVLCFGDMESIQTGWRFFRDGARFSWLCDHDSDVVVLDEPLRLLLDRRNFVPCVTVLARREDIVAVGGHDESLRYFEDTDLWLKLAPRGPFVGVCNPLARFSQLPEGLTVQLYQTPEYDVPVLISARNRLLRERSQLRTHADAACVEKLLMAAAKQLAKGDVATASMLWRRYGHCALWLRPRSIYLIGLHCAQRILLATRCASR